ncbi:hypothetical protein QE418_000632 [Microbacterium testaceum]|uniref:hypothetical protein n=1 Tax=Microbacterium TaxID=33882 RepID=UPI002788F167|nr:MULTISPECIES: hypothetical protein [Microbacterium]MDQ1111184.1 hypothetical protein [Microbacterium testaceum]MDR6098276.1 hypothetical protein [Microbacterium sp. SORGH_AS_0454]
MDEWWGSLTLNVASALVIAAFSSAVTWYLARRKRAVWILEHVRGENWTLTYRGRRAAWDVQIGQTISPTVSARLYGDNPKPPLSAAFSDWTKDCRTQLGNFERGEELTLTWHDHGRRRASIQTRESQSRYEVAAADVRRDSPSPIVSRK